jgi:uncharacterized protein YabN with tetrapyrrole methylase and pyrophosphatase domain
MKNFMEQIKKFNDERDWSQIIYMKDYLLNIAEETGEAWNIIKWIKEDKIEEHLKKHKDHMEDFVGDVIYLILKISYLTGIDPEKAIKRTIEDYEERFPIDKVKGHHGNPLAGGYDKKHSG